MDGNILGALPDCNARQGPRNYKASTKSLQSSFPPSLVSWFSNRRIGASLEFVLSSSMLGKVSRGGAAPRGSETLIAYMWG